MTSYNAEKLQATHMSKQDVFFSGTISQVLLLILWTTPMNALSVDIKAFMEPRPDVEQECCDFVSHELH